MEHEGQPTKRRKLRNPGPTQVGPVAKEKPINRAMLVRTNVEPVECEAKCVQGRPGAVVHHVRSNPLPQPAKIRRAPLQLGGCRPPTPHAPSWRAPAPQIPRTGVSGGQESRGSGGAVLAWLVMPPLECLRHLRRLYEAIRAIAGTKAGCKPPGAGPTELGRFRVGSAPRGPHRIIGLLLNIILLCVLGPHRAVIARL